MYFFISCSILNSYKLYRTLISRVHRTNLIDPLCLNPPSGIAVRQPFIFVDAQILEFLHLLHEPLI